MPHRPLTPRQLEVLRLVGQGRSNKEIAKEMGISVATVKSHLSRIHYRWGTRGRTASMFKALSKGLLRDEEEMV